MEVDGMGKTLSWTYDEEGKLVRYTDMSNAVVLFGYDGLGRKISQTSSARGTDGLRQNIVYSYDKAGLLSRIEDVTSRQLTTYEYDLAGNRIHEKTEIINTVPGTVEASLPSDPDAVAVIELYEVLLGRHPDPTGLAYWTSRYAAIKADVNQRFNGIALLAEVMLSSDEAREIFKSNGSVGEFVDELFAIAVGRKPDPAVREAYVSQFDNGYNRRGRVVAQFLLDLRPAERAMLDTKIGEALHTVASGPQDVVTVVQDNTIEFDDLGRMRVVRGLGSWVEFTYDANGNRLEVKSAYRTAASGHIGVEGAPVESDVLNTYDKANRQLFVNAVKVDDELQIGQYGHKLSYDSAGNRSSDMYRRKPEDASTVVTDTYKYDSAGRMTTTSRDGWVIDLRQYDIGGRLIRSGITFLGTDRGSERQRLGLDPALDAVTSSVREEYQSRLEGWEIATNYRAFNYDAAGRILRQKERDFDGKELNDIKYVSDGMRTTPMGYDNAGRLRGYFLVPAHSDMTEQYNYSITYSFQDSAQQATISVKRGGLVRTTTNAYDQNGNLIRVTAPRLDTEVAIDRVYVNDVSGHVLRMMSGSEVTTSLVVNEQLFGSFGGAGGDAPSGIFANTFRTARDLTEGGASQSVYVVQSGTETLKTIATMVWGDSSLWYLIADANGLTGEALTAGMPLQIPSRVSPVRNDYASFKPYDRSSIDGIGSPSLPAPAGKGGCGPVGMLVVIVVACILNAFMPGAGTVLGQMFIGAVSSAAGQLAAIEAGEQDRFSWKSVALSAVSAGMTQGVSEGMAGNEVFGNAVADKAFNAAVANAMTQGIGVAMHWQEHFQWRGVAAAAARAGVNEAVGESMPDSPFRGPVAAFAGGAAGAIARGGRIRFGEALGDAFGNVLAESLKNELEKQSAAEKVAEVTKTVMENRARVAAAISKKSVEVLDDNFESELKALYPSRAGFGDASEPDEASHVGLYEKALRKVADYVEQAGVSIQGEIENGSKRGILLKDVLPKDIRQDAALMGGVGAGILDVLQPFAMGADMADAVGARNVLKAIFGSEDAQNDIVNVGKRGVTLLKDTMMGIGGFATNVLNGDIGKQISQVMGDIGSESPKERAAAARIVTSIVLGVALGGEGGIEVANFGLARLGSLTTKLGERVATFVERAGSVKFVGSRGSSPARRIAAQRGSIDLGVNTPTAQPAAAGQSVGANSAYENALFNMEARQTQAASDGFVKAVAERRNLFVAKPGTDDFKFLEMTGADASAGGPGNLSILVKGENPQRLTLMEEFLHGTQSKRWGDPVMDVTGADTAFREWHVRDFMNRHSQMLGWDASEKAVLKTELDYWAAKAGKGGKP